MNRNVRRTTHPTVAPSYTPTPHEQQAAAKLAEHRAKSPEITLKSKDGVVQMQIQHADDAAGHAALLSALGCNEPGFVNPFIGYLVNATAIDGKPDDDAANFALSVVKGIEPRDQIEAMLAAQMAVVHVATMSFARRITNAQHLAQRDSACTALNKLARTMATQVEALKRYRTGGEQRVLVQHVNVSEGGQAIVGNVTAGGGGAHENKR
jgi:hypothetical protein